jgi:hypothetical protein
MPGPQCKTKSKSKRRTEMSSFTVTESRHAPRAKEFLQEFGAFSGEDAAANLNLVIQ